MTLSLAAVFIPVLFMGGIVGRLFHEFAVTIGVAILISGVRLADADADAVQPVPAAAGARRATGALYAASETRLPRHAAICTTGPCAGRCGTG